MTTEAEAKAADTLGFEFEDVTPPTFLPPSFDGETGDAAPKEPPTCVTCADEGIVTVLDYSGRGRLPKYCDAHKGGKSKRPAAATPRRGGTADVNAACAVLDGLYSTMLAPLMMFTPQAATQFAGQIDALNDRNRAILSADPKLAKRIVEASGKGGAAALVLSHAVVFVPVSITAMNEIRNGR